MTCHEAREQFSALVDEALDAEARTAFDAHLAGCAECQRELDAFRRTVALMRGIEPARAPAGFVDRVLAAARPEPWPRRLTRRLFRPWAVKVPLEAAALIVVGVLAVWLFQRMPEQQQMMRTDAPSAVTSAQAPAPPPPPAPAPRVASETKSVGPPPTASRAQDRQAPRVPPRPAPAPADKRESTDALGYGGEARGQLAREGFRDQPAEPERRYQELSPRAPQVAAEARKEAPASASAPAVAEAKRAQIQSTTAERDKDAAASQALGFMPPPPASQVAGRLAASDHERAERDLQALTAKHGGTIVWRRGDGRVTLLDVEIPRDVYARFAADVARLGRWTVDREARELPETVRVQIQLE